MFTLVVLLAGLNTGINEEASDSGVHPAIVACSVFFLKSTGCDVETREVKNKFNQEAGLSNDARVSFPVLTRVFAEFGVRIESVPASDIPAAEVPAPGIISYRSQGMSKLMFIESHDSNGIWVVDYNSGVMNRFHVSYSDWKSDRNTSVYFESRRWGIEILVPFVMVAFAVYLMFVKAPHRRPK